MSNFEVAFATVCACIAFYFLIDFLKSDRRIDLMMSGSLCLIFGLIAGILFVIPDSRMQQIERVEAVGMECIEEQK